MEKEVKSLEERISGAKASAMGDAGEEECERLAQIEQVQSDIQARSNEEKKLSDGLANLEQDWNQAKVGKGGPGGMCVRFLRGCGFWRKGW